MKKVAIIYGWAEGPWQSRQFAQAAARRGLTMTTDLSRADIIFAHSSGCYLVPEDVNARLVMLVGLPYWPGQILPSGILRKLISELEHHRRTNGLIWWLNKITHNTWYILTRPQATYWGLTRHKEKNLPDGRNRTVLLVRPSDDTMHHPETADLLTKAESYESVEIPGAHDDCWLYPEPYLDLIERFERPQS